VADFLSDGLDAADLSIQVTLGSPANAAPQKGDNQHRVNLFFYRIEPFGFGDDVSPGEVGWIRLHCLITAFGVLEDKISVGENDLRLLGEVIRLFHETPVLAPFGLDGETIRLQVVLQPLGTDDINHLWSTQGDVAYRTSVAYEMAVMPVIPKQRAVASPLAGSVGYEVRGSLRSSLPFAGSSVVPPAASVAVHTGNESWAPHICFLYQESCAYSLAFALGSDELAAFDGKVIVLGEPGAALTLRWDRWTSAAGWTTEPDATEATASVDSLDPDQLADVETTPVTLPFDEAAGQAVLYATRSYTRASDGAELTVRSNPLLITLYEAAA
jgi:hypothetical protein